MSCEKSNEKTCECTPKNNINYIILIVLYILLAIILGAVIF